MKLFGMLSTSLKHSVTSVWYRMMLVITFEQNFLFYFIRNNKLTSIYANNPTYPTNIYSFLSIRKEKQGDQIESLLR